MSLVSIGTSPRPGIESGQILSDYSRLFAAKKLIGREKAQNSQKKVESRASRVESLRGFPPVTKLPAAALSAL